MLAAYYSFLGISKDIQGICPRGKCYTQNGWENGLEVCLGREEMSYTWLSLLRSLVFKRFRQV